MKKSFAFMALVIGLVGCGTTIKNEYTVTGNSNHFECASTAGLEKTVDSRLGASVSATAAASQQGDATNSGSSESSAMGDGK